MQLTLLHGYPDLIGKRFAFVGYGTGPASYSRTTGDAIALPIVPELHRCHQWCDIGEWDVCSSSGSVNSRTARNLGAALVCHRYGRRSGERR
jgi:hypothetical protein